MGEEESEGIRRRARENARGRFGVEVFERGWGEGWGEVMGAKGKRNKGE